MCSGEPGALAGGASAPGRAHGSPRLDIVFCGCPHPARGESALRRNSRLERAAQSHTESMAFGDYFEHIGPGGDTPFSRIRGSGYIYSSSVGYAVGENIGWGTLWLGTPQAIVAAWMNSPAHRAIMLDGRYRDTAIGVSPHPPGSLAGGQRGAVYTQDFGVIITG